MFKIFTFLLLFGSEIRTLLLSCIENCWIVVQKSKKYSMHCQKHKKKRACSGFILKWFCWKMPDVQKDFLNICWPFSNILKSNLKHRRQNCRSHPFWHFRLLILLLLLLKIKIQINLNYPKRFRKSNIFYSIVGARKKSGYGSTQKRRLRQPWS